jgi:hypothetical protein
LVKEEVPKDGEIPSFDGAKIQKQERLRKGLQQACKIVVGAGLDLQGDLGKFGEEKDGFYHLVIDIAAITAADPNSVTRQLSYAKLTEESNGWTVHLSKQKVVFGDRCHTLETLFGNFGTRRCGKTASGASATSGDIQTSEGTDCVICLTNPRDTAIMPCRHVCLCTTCANVTSSTWSFQCPVCRARVASMVKLDDSKT